MASGFEPIYTYHRPGISIIIIIINLPIPLSGMD
jgi:hypothetical protein